jgi:hypothetical protein
MISQLKYATKSRWENKYRVRSQFIAILFFISSVGCLTPVMVTAAAQPNATSSIEVEFEQGRLTLNVRDTPLAEVLQAISEKAGIAIEIRGDLTAHVTESLTNVPLDQGIRQLLRDQSFAIEYEPSVNDPDKQPLSDNRLTRLTGDHKKTSNRGQRRRWYLQVSSSPKQSEAIKLVAALKAKGYHAYFVQALVRGRTWHRVRLGPLSTEAEARTLRSLIVSTEQLRDAFIGRDAPTVAQANKLQEPVPQVKPAGSNPAAPQRIKPVEITVLAGSWVESGRTAEKVATPREAREVFQNIQVLGRRQDTEAIGKLSSLAGSDPRPGVRSQAVSALGRLRNQEALAPLTLALADQSSSVRIRAMQAIKNLKGTEAIGDLYAMVATDPDPVVRREALRLLSEVESVEVLGLLNGAVADPDPSVSQEARQAVKIWEQRFDARYGMAE